MTSNWCSFDLYLQKGSLVFTCIARRWALGKLGVEPGQKPTGHRCIDFGHVYNNIIFVQ